MVKKFLWYKRKQLLLLLGFVGVFVLTFYLYNLPIQAVIYPSVLCLLIGIIYLVIRYRSEKRIHEALKMIDEITLELKDNLPLPTSTFDEDYQNIISIFEENKKRDDQKNESEFNDMVDYYTLWAHQIKTPIASMRLSLQAEDSKLSRKLQNDLNRIESYVNMVLTYLRLDSDSTDYLFRETNLDEVIKTVIKKFKGDFIQKKLSLNYTGTDVRVMTDEKWLSFAIEQVLSNAVKYTNSGEISIYLTEPKVLVIKDTGIGIADEDIPRIFENGYTGFNGRTDKRASGIGLYLTKRVLDNLGHEITVASKVGVGTEVRINLNSKRNLFE